MEGLSGTQVMEHSEQLYKQQQQQRQQARSKDQKNLELNTSWGIQLPALKKQ